MNRGIQNAKFKMEKASVHSNNFEFLILNFKFCISHF